MQSCQGITLDVHPDVLKRPSADSQTEDADGNIYLYFYKSPLK